MDDNLKNLFYIITSNIIAHYLFLFQYKFYSDDWPQLFFVNTLNLNYIFSTERPIMYFLLNIEALFFGQHAIWYHIVALFFTTLFLILLYGIIYRIALDFNVPPQNVTFLSTLVFCLLINKDEVYSWPTISLANNFAYTMFLLSLFFFLNKDNNKNFYLSIFCYSIGLFTYEVGVALPLFYIGYLIILGKKWRCYLLSFIPLLLYLSLRVTHLWGFGTAGTRGICDIGIIIRILTSPLIFYDLSVNRIKYGVIGLLQMDHSILVCIFIINAVFLSALYITLKKRIIVNGSYGNYKKLILISIFLIFIFSIPLILRGYYLLSKDTRLYYLIDIGIALFIVSILCSFFREKSVKILIVCIIGLLLFTNQGLSYNWVISGDFQGDINNYICEKSDILKTYGYIYFNSSSFREKRPNSLKPSELLPFSEIIPYSTIIAKVQPKIFYFDEYFFDDDTFGYFSYYNAKALDIWPLSTMLDIYAPKKDRILFYSKYQDMPHYMIGRNNSAYTFFDRQTNQYGLLKSEQVFEINYSGVYLS